jgi:hypothetical protein
VNPKGHKSTLVARHDGNTNAVKFGVYSNRLIDVRAVEITNELEKSGALGLIGSLAVQEAARCVALLEAIDQDLAERGVVDKKGNARSLLDLRLRVSTQLERWLDRVQAEVDSEPLRSERADYIRELQRIALGRDRGARTQDRLNAIKQLLSAGDRGTTSYLESEESEDVKDAKAWREMQRTEAKDSVEDARARREIDKVQRAEDLDLRARMLGVR